MIESQSLCYCAGEKDILKDISVSIKAGQILAILGPNGAGKSTLLKTLCGTLCPQAGAVFLQGTRLDKLSIETLSKRRAVLSQSADITFPFSAREIVMMGRSPHLVDRESHNDQQIVDEILKRLEAQELEDRLFSTLSGGERQRIQFARVLAQIWDQEQACLFLDEPTSALDIRQQMNIVGLSRDLSRERGFAVCMIVHDLNLARHYADEILFIKKGQVMAYGTPEEVMQASVIAQTFDIPNSYALKYAAG